MRPTTQDDYRERILKVLVHIQQHLDEDLSLEALAAVAFFSPYHFHRIFRGNGRGVGEGARSTFAPRARRTAARAHRKGQLLVSAPRDIDRVIRTVRKGKLVTRSQILDLLAEEQGADMTCPLCTGIFIRITAEAAEEAREEGKKRVTPYWRVVADDGSLNEKIPGGSDGRADRLREEGHEIGAKKGKKPPKVVEFESKLQKL